ncbi:MAG TPA: hypothetical protein VLJ86_10240 [Ramlibacter sp.]|nr:hypothetical protein [Ramlibacter sp.]
MLDTAVRKRKVDQVALTEDALNLASAHIQDEGSTSTSESTDDCKAAYRAKLSRCVGNRSPHRARAVEKAPSLALDETAAAEIFRRVADAASAPGARPAHLQAGLKQLLFASADERARQVWRDWFLDQAVALLRDASDDAGALLVEATTIALGAAAMDAQTRKWLVGHCLQLTAPKPQDDIDGLETQRVRHMFGGLARGLGAGPTTQRAALVLVDDVLSDVDAESIGSAVIAMHGIAAVCLGDGNAAQAREELFARLLAATAARSNPAACAAFHGLGNALGGESMAAPMQVWLIDRMMLSATRIPPDAPGRDAQRRSLGARIVGLAHSLGANTTPGVAGTCVARVLQWATRVPAVALADAVAALGMAAGGARMDDVDRDDLFLEIIAQRNPLTREQRVCAMQGWGRGLGGARTHGAARDEPDDAQVAMADQAPMKPRDVLHSAVHRVLCAGRSLTKDVAFDLMWGFTHSLGAERTPLAVREAVIDSLATAFASPDDLAHLQCAVEGFARGLGGSALTVRELDWLVDALHARMGAGMGAARMYAIEALGDALGGSSMATRHRAWFFGCLQRLALAPGDGVVAAGMAHGLGMTLGGREMSLSHRNWWFDRMVDAPPALGRRAIMSIAAGLGSSLDFEFASEDVQAWLVQRMAQLRAHGAHKRHAAIVDGLMWAAQMLAPLEQPLEWIKALWSQPLDALKAGQPTNSKRLPALMQAGRSADVADRY